MLQLPEWKLLSAIVATSCTAGASVFHIAQRIRNVGRSEGRKESQSAEMQAALEALKTQLEAIDGRLQKMDVKLQVTAHQSDTTWKFLMRRARVEFVDRGVGTVNSPVLVTPSVRQQFPPGLADKLHEFYREIRQAELTDTELMLLIEKEMGDEISREVCTPLHLHLGACLWLAAAVAKEVN